MLAANGSLARKMQHVSVLVLSITCRYLLVFPLFSLLLVLQLCGLTGGPCPYTVRTMKAAHADLNPAPRHFNALVEDLQDAMDAEHVSFWTQNRLLALLAPMHRDVVAARAGAKPEAAP